MPIGKNVVLAMAPEVIHSVQLRATLGQPDQADAQLSGQVLRTVCSVAWILVQEQGDMPTPVMAMNDCQKSSEVLTTLPLTCQEQPMPGVDVDRAEDDSPGIEPRDWHLRRLAAQPPCGAQRREEQEVRFVLEQLDTTRWQLADFYTGEAQKSTNFYGKRSHLLAVCATK